MPQLAVILGETGDLEPLPPLAAMNAVLLKSRSGYPPSASMTALWMALLRHLANQVSTLCINMLLALLEWTFQRRADARLKWSGTLSSGHPVPTAPVVESGGQRLPTLQNYGIAVKSHANDAPSFALQLPCKRLAVDEVWFCKTFCCDKQVIQM